MSDEARTSDLRASLGAQIGLFDPSNPLRTTQPSRPDPQEPCSADLRGTSTSTSSNEPCPTAPTRDYSLVPVVLTDEIWKQHGDELPAAAKGKSVVWYCAPCSEIAGKKCWLAGGRGSNVVWNHQRTVKHTQNVRRLTIEAGSLPHESPDSRDQARNAMTPAQAADRVVKTFVKACLSFNQSRTLMDGIGTMITWRDVPSHMQVFPDSSRTFRRKMPVHVQDLARRLTEKTKAECGGLLVAISFDGGKLVSKGMHVECMMIHKGSKSYGLPLMTTPSGDGSAFNSDDLVGEIKKELAKVDVPLSHVRYIMSDAAAVNMAAGRKMGQFQLAEEDVVNVRTLGQELDDNNDDASIDEVDPNFLNAMDAVGNAAPLKQARHLRCVAHQLVLVVNDALDDVHWAKSMCDFVKSVNDYFKFTPDRRARFRKFVAQYRTAALEDTLRQLELIQCGLTYKDPHQSRSCVVDLLNSLWDDVKHLKDLLPIAGLTPDDVQRIMEEIRAIVNKQVPMAFKNDTRWQNSTYRCVEFAWRNYSAIIEFAASERSRCKSAEHLISLLGNNQSSLEKRNEVRQRLKEYVEVFAPIAEVIAEFSNHQPFQGTKIFHRLQSMERRLEEASAPGSPTEANSKKLLLAYRKRQNAMATQFWNAVSFLVPLHVATECAASLTHEKRETTIGTICGMMRAELHVGTELTSEFVKESRAYVEKVIAMSLSELRSSDPWTFWQKFPDGVLKPQAMAALSVPPVVTLCDSVFSVTKSALTVQQARMDLDVAKAYLQVKINGDDFEFGNANAN